MNIMYTWSWQHCLGNNVGIVYNILGKEVGIESRI